MEYKKIIAITGMGSLYELLSSKTDGAIVRSLEDNSTKFIASRVHNFSHLESIEVYSQKENVNLVEIFKLMEESKEPLPDVKNIDAVKKYFKEVYPDLDFERVYASDMKKMVKWFEVLRNKVDFKLSDDTEEEVHEDVSVEDVSAPEEEEEVIKKPAKKPAKKPVKKPAKKAAKAKGK